MQPNGRLWSRPYLYPIVSIMCLAFIIEIFPYFTTDCTGQKIADTNFDTREPVLKSDRSLWYETPELLIASKVLPEDLIMGENYQVVGKLTTTVTGSITYGYTNRFKIISTFGNFVAPSQDMVRILVQEIKAIAILREIRKKREFNDALEQAGKSSFSAAQDLILHPPDTATGIPLGEWRFLSHSGEIITGSNDILEKEENDILAGFSKLKRRYAYKLGVDVYSRNKELQRVLNSVTWAGFASGVGVSLLSDSLDSTENMVIERSPFLAEIDGIILDSTPDDLQRINREKLKQMGVEDSLIEKFLANPKFSPRQRTIIVHVLTNMGKVKNRGIYIQQSLTASHEELAFLHQRKAEMMYDYHKNVSPILEIIPIGESGVVGLCSDQTIVAILPLDQIYWTELTDLFITETLGLFKSPDYSVKQFKICVSGKFSSRAKMILSEAGITLKEHVRY
ncbi:MAG: hypothetical protein D8M57_17530 [Candidatus Scalindua sp. AMX11]|nr:MAG: hypothetical protein DWQ00_16295 [Candidatus Scalindua sp.]NOG84300.1 hypothetical protein [Planctomycetota bacterium]RZV66425.1 MAG: hypothetical protein EX341_17535 [Candidatus Scalindua sp. SCAELEC01]TDE63594.1 MAG: hypothetical protein D8M57_17530 [Candidatus Scalindua sp. AMX11]GJQ57245.1 MAG: hypothetical protein SCALA701_00460 [Candidatus Scalindua sp.]